MTPYDIPGMVQSTFYLILTVMLSSIYYIPILWVRKQSFWKVEIST